MTRSAFRPDEPPALSVSTDRAEAYFARRLYPDAWLASSAADRRKALDGAASLLAVAFCWDADAFPGGVWRGEIADLVCEEALWLLERGGAPSPAAFGVKRASAGPLAVTFDSAAAPGPAAGLIAPSVAELAAAWSRPAAAGGRIASTPLG